VTKTLEEGRNIVAVGYPAQDWRSDLALQDRIFRGTYNVKRLQPGALRQRANIRSFANLVNAVTHDASTLGGNSGSAIIDVETQQVLGLHFAGEYLKANYAVPMFELARDARVIAKKLNFDSTLTPTNDWEPAWLSAGETEAPVGTAKTQRTPSAHLQSSAPAAGSTSIEQSPAAAPVPTTADAAIWTIPINVTVSIGTAQRAASPAVPTEAGSEEAVVVDQDYSTRPGYDPEFLDGVTVPLPKLTTASMKSDTAQVRADARKHNDPFELAYYHYSVYMNKKRRTAWFSAANVDGDHRPNIGTRSGDHRRHGKARIDPGRRTDHSLRSRQPVAKIRAAGGLSRRGRWQTEGLALTLSIRRRREQWRLLSGGAQRGATDNGEHGAHNYPTCHGDLSWGMTIDRTLKSCAGFRFRVAAGWPGNAARASRRYRRKRSAWPAICRPGAAVRTGSSEEVIRAPV
jgi:hypothetical protein